MTRAVTAALVLAALFATSALAALKPGDAAPDFTAQATLGGKDFSFSLAEALQRGPVVLYFFPKAFTTGCTEEAHQFAEAAAQFEAAGATLIGMSGDDIDTLHKFSVQACSSRFPVAADPDLKVVKAYDSAMIRIGSVGLAARISYVIAPDGRIAYAYADRSPDKHVENTLAAVKAITKK